MPQILAIAFLKMARTSPTLPPSAINTSAIAGLFSRAGENHADVVEDRGDRRMRLVYGFRHIVGTDDPGPLSRGQNMRGDRAAQPLVRFRWRNGADEAFARCPYQQG